MWFLIKSAFWFSVVLISLPLLEGERPEDASAQTPSVEIGDTLAAIGVAIEDVRAICERHPDVCATGTDTVTALGHRARDGARIIYTYLDHQLAASESGSALAEADPSPAPTLDGDAPKPRAASTPAGATASPVSNVETAIQHAEALRTIAALYPGSSLAEKTAE